MTSPIQQITIRCPKCGLQFESWWRASINLALDDFDDAYVQAARVKTCPHCGQKVAMDMLVVSKDGTWLIDSEEDPSGEA